MTTIKQLKEYGKKYIVSPQVEAILCNLLKINSFELLDSLDNIISEDIENEFKDKILRVYNTKKITSAIEQINFCNLHFKINDNVLLPHFETQEVVMQTMEYIEKFFYGKGNLIDVGCGSGVIGLTIKNKFKELKIDMIDISDNALEITTENAKLLKLNVDIYRSDMLKNAKNKYDIIISNPPYENINYKPTLDNEPSISLYAENNGLYYFEEILKNAREKLNNKYMIVLEIGDYQKESVIDLANKYLKDITIRTLESRKGFEKSIYIFGGFKKEDFNG